MNMIFNINTTELRQILKRFDDTINIQFVENSDGPVHGTPYMCISGDVEVDGVIENKRIKISCRAGEK